MIKNLVKQSFIWFLIVGCVGFAFGLTTTGLSVVAQRTIQYGSFTWTFYQIDTNAYLQSINHSLSDASILNIVPTTPQLPAKPDWTDVLSVLKFFVNSMFIFATNIVIYALNWIILGPIKLVLYPVNIFYAILGLKTAGTDYIRAMNILYSLEIPLIKPL